MADFVPRTFAADEFPEGLRCCDCQRLFVEEQPISERLYAMGEYADEPLACVELICVECSLGVGDTNG